MISKKIIVLFLVIMPVFLLANGSTKIKDSNIGKSFTKDVLIYEDKNRQIEIEDIIKMSNDSFVKVEVENPSVQFTKSRFWLKFSVTNESENWDFILETARTITDKVYLYQVNSSNEIISVMKNGDDFNYYKKDIPHRKNLFPLQIKKGETQFFYVAVISGGEGILLPIRIHEKMAFFKQDYKDQFKNGFYYGVMGLVVVINFFFYVLLRDRSFLYYILYVFFQGMLQFSLDGYSHHHFFPSNDFMVNRFPPFAGAMGIVFMLIYVSNYLKLSKKKPRLNKAFIAAILLIVIATIFIFLPGIFHSVSYPMVNAFSLISIVLSVASIFYLRATGNKVDNYFTLAFVVLISGAIIFILGNFGIIQNSSISLNALKVCSVIEVVILSISMSFKYRELQKEKEDAQAVALKNLEDKNAVMDEINVRLEEQVIERTSEIESQRAELALQNSEIVSSIKYAQRIQEAILPSSEQVSELLIDSFVFYLPKDVVSGDFYFVEKKVNSKTDSIVFAAVDCTGHGVPGAFMSIVGNNFLSQSINEKSVTNPAEILQFLNKGVSETLRQNIKGESVRDGMDMSLCMIDSDHKVLQFAGAKNPIYIIRKKSDSQISNFGLLREENDTHVLLEVKGDKQPIGNHSGVELASFTNHKIDLQKGDSVYLFTDGFADQFGGSKGKKYNYKQFRKLLLDNIEEPMASQKLILQKSFSNWVGNNEQIDDVLVIGVKI
ncbi:MAG: 7TM diverse intracellular signaling domain-containing protein [Crocinitomicaceae bacterium]